MPLARGKGRQLYSANKRKNALGVQNFPELWSDFDPNKQTYKYHRRLMGPGASKKFQQFV